MTHLPHYTPQDLIHFAKRCFISSGLEASRAQIVANKMIEADLMGHDTHGIRMLNRYLADIRQGNMVTDGEPKVISDRGPCALWDAHLLPGHWVLQRGIELAIPRAKQYGSMMMGIRRSHHVGALNVHLTSIVEHGLIGVLWATDSKVRSVAPFGGIDPVLTTDPIAAGIPTSGAPILIDTTTSLCSNALVKQTLERGEQLPSEMLKDNEGKPTRNPNALFTDPPGTILPLGGMTHGYKGYSLAMLVNVMSLALPGFGKASGEKNEGIMLHIIDPDAFGGEEAFLQETDWMVDASRASQSISGAPIRLPGDRARELSKERQADGIPLEHELFESLAPYLQAHKIEAPSALQLVR